MQEITCIGKYGSQLRRKQDFIAKGNFGQVYRGYQIKKPNNKVAIKLIKINSSEQQQSIRNQISNMLKVHSEYIIEVYAFEKIQLNQQTHFGIAVQLMDGNLKKLKKQKQKIPQKQAIQWIWKIIQCYKILYQKGLMHRDLKPQNILFKKNNNNELIFKLGDFGSSRDVYSLIKKNFTPGKGSFGYLSPQQYKSNEYTNKTDVYSLGAIFFELLNGFSNTLLQLEVTSFPSLKLNSQRLNEVLDQLDIMPQTKKFIKKCLQEQEKNRYDWTEIFSHQIFIKAGSFSQNNSQEIIRKCSSSNQIVKSNQQGYSIFRNVGSFIGKLIKGADQRYLQKFPQKIQQLLKGSKRIKIRPDKQGIYFSQQRVKIDERNPNICYTIMKNAIIFSTESITNNDQNFYFCIKIIKLYKNNQIAVGISHPWDINFAIKSKGVYNIVAYYLPHQKFVLFNRELCIKNQQLSAQQIKQYPSQIIVFINRKSNKMYVIFNNLIQIQMSIQQAFKKYQNKWKAFVQIGGYSVIQFL